MSKKKQIQDYESKRLIDELSKMPPMVIATAYLHAINYTLYGEDVTKKWVTATQNAAVLEKAYRKGYHDALQRQAEWISVNEQLPKENRWYQCTVILNDLPQTIELFYKNGKWLDNRRIDMFNTYDIYGYGNTKEKHKLSYQELISEFEWDQVVIAWKPLSQPYEAESEE
jgi:hypothetical protein